MEISEKPKGRSPIVLDLEDTLIKFLNTVGLKSGVANIQVVWATPKALDESNGSNSQKIQNFTMPSAVGPVTVSLRYTGYTKSCWKHGDVQAFG